MKQLTILFFSLVLTSNLFSQWTVKHLNTLSNFNTIQKISFFNDTLGYAMGSNGLILRTTDTGETWNYISTTIEGDIVDFDFCNSGEIILTTIFEKGTYKSSNGIDYEKVFISEWDLSNVECSPSNKVYLSGAEIIYQSIDQGETWDTVFNLKFHGFKLGHIRDISFANSFIGYAVGDGLDKIFNTFFNSFLLKTVDGGDNWELIKKYPYDSLGTFNSVYFGDELTGFILTGGQTLVTSNGGENWNKVQDMYGAVDLEIINEQKIFTVNRPQAYNGDATSTVFLINESYEGGQTWNNPEFRNGAHLETIQFLNDYVGFVAGDYSLIMKTENCGGEIGDGYPWNLFTTSITIKEPSQLEIQIYPNPTSNILLFKSIQEYNLKYQILDLNGKIIQHGKVTNNSIDISNLNFGNYILILNGQESHISFKIIKGMD